MAPARVALGLAAALPALLLGASTLAMAADGADPARAGVPFALLVLGGVAIALGGLLRERRAWVVAGAVAMAAGGAPLRPYGLGLVVILSGILLVSLAAPPGRPDTLRRAARLVTAGALIFLGLLAWRNRSAGTGPDLLDALLWAALLLLAGYAWWPRFPPGSPRDVRGKATSRAAGDQDR